MADDDLVRFERAQEGTYAVALGEVRAGRKRSHWMWFVFPQLGGLGSSPAAEYYALTSLDEAQAYLDHPVLGPRLVEITRAVTELDDPDPHAVFGHPDDLKARSCWTLFAHVPRPNPVFAEALGRCFAGQEDPLTLRLLGLTDEAVG